MRWAIVLATLAIAAILSCDPVLDDKVTSLGDEAPGERPGPTHRAGQPCTTCHDGALGDPVQFSVAGTVFQTADAKQALAGATVTVTGADGATYALTTNEVGNFYLEASVFAPRFPMRVCVSSGGTTVTMQSHVGWASSCATCHADPAGPDSPGHVYFDVPDGAVP